MKAEFGNNLPENQRGKTHPDQETGQAAHPAVDKDFPARQDEADGPEKKYLQHCLGHQSKIAQDFHNYMIISQDNHY
jgi:hypothetical protein